MRGFFDATRGGMVVALGYGVPYLGPFRQDAACLAALMPETQGALVWPSAGSLLSVLVEDRQLPLPDNSVDRLLLVHSLEATDRPATLLREVWRVLVPEGRLLIVVPNRRSVWARIDTTPFGHGRPYSRSQLERLLVDVVAFNRIVEVDEPVQLLRAGDVLSDRGRGGGRPIIGFGEVRQPDHGLVD